MSTSSGRATDRSARWVLAAIALSVCGGGRAAGSDAWPPAVLPRDHGAPFVERFNAADDETIVNLIPNARSAGWVASEAPRFDCPSTRFVETYYFRWWTYRKHIKQTADGRVLTEFITPVSHAGPHNTIACALGHHVAEGRWLRDASLLDEYLRFWLVGGPDGQAQPHLHKFSGWVAAAIDARRAVTGDGRLAVELLDELVTDYHRWEEERQLPDGLFWQYDVRDGMEESISGGRREKNVRPTINAYMVGNANAIASIARSAERTELADEFEAKAAALQRAVIDALWDDEAQFFKVRLESGDFSDAREAIGFLPWLYSIGEPAHSAAWTQIRDRRGFWAPRGLTTAERRHPKFRTHGTGTCEWDGAVWPFATSQTLGALANALRDSAPLPVSRRDYFEQLLRYAEAHEKDGVAYLGEYHDEVTGEWLIVGEKERRSRYYNHSTFCDLVIGGLVGVVPRLDGTIEIDPLLPDDSWDWFCLDGVPYHGHSLSVLWDRDGQRYGRGAGLRVLLDGQEVAVAKELGRVVTPLASANPTEEPE